MKTAALALVLLAASPAFAQDVLKLRSGSEVKGKITALGAKTVGFADGAGKVTTYRAEEVLDITFSDTPASLKSATGAVTNKNWDKALAQCETALAEIGPGKARDFHKGYVYFQWALALEGKGQGDKALEKLRALRSEFNDHRLRPDSFLKSLEIARKAGDTALEGVLSEMSGDGDPQIAGNASLERAKLLYSKAKYDDALAAYGKLSGSFTADGRLGKLRCLRALKKTDEVASLCSQFLADKANTSPALMQTCAASLGDQQLKGAGNDKEKILAALRTCTQAISVGPPATKEPSVAEDYALALLNAARCCALLSKVVEKNDSKNEYKERATRYYAEVIGTYRNTEWATTAQKERGALGS